MPVDEDFINNFIGYHILKTKYIVIIYAGQVRSRSHFYSNQEKE